MAKAKGGHDKITPDGKWFFEQIKQLKGLEVRVGYQRDGQGKGKKGEDINEPKAKFYNPETGKIEYSDVDLIDVAVFNENGTSRAPARPFMKQSVDNNKESISKMCTYVLKKIKGGEMTAEEALNKVGAMQVGLVQNEIGNGDFAPNSPETIKRKSRKGKLSDTPLIDTAQLRQSVHYIIEPKGGGG